MFDYRIKKVQESLSKGQAALVTSDANRFYLTGFNSSAGAVLITKDAAYFLIDFRYFEKAKNTVKHLSVMLLEKLYFQISGILKNLNVTEILLETDCVTLSVYDRYLENLSDFKVSKEDTLDTLLHQLRSIKSRQELNLVKQAQELTDKTFSYILNRIKAGITERDVMLDMEFFMRKEGSEGVSFDFIVVSGENSSLPHGVPTDKPIKRGDFVTMDFGAVVGGYRSDMTRTVAVGQVSDEQRLVYNTVLSAQKSALKEIREGKICKDIDAIARNIIEEAGYNGCFGHGLGHSVGIEIHESPAFNTRCETVLKSGMVMTVEPGIYLESKFGVRIEDMVHVTENGCENLTKSSKELIIL